MTCSAVRQANAGEKLGWPEAFYAQAVCMVAPELGPISGVPMNPIGCLLWLVEYDGSQSKLAKLALAQLTERLGTLWSEDRHGFLLALIRIGDTQCAAVLDHLSLYVGPGRAFLRYMLFEHKWVLRNGVLLGATPWVLVERAANEVKGSFHLMEQVWREALSPGFSEALENAPPFRLPWLYELLCTFCGVTPVPLGTVSLMWSRYEDLVADVLSLPLTHPKREQLKRMRVAVKRTDITVTLSCMTEGLIREHLAAKAASPNPRAYESVLAEKARVYRQTLEIEKDGRCTLSSHLFWKLPPVADIEAELLCRKRLRDDDDDRPKKRARVLVDE